MTQQNLMFLFKAVQWATYQIQSDYSIFFLLLLFTFICSRFLITLAKKDDEIDSAFLDRVIKYGTKKTNKKLTDKLIADGVLPSPEDRKKKKKRTGDLL